MTSHGESNTNPDSKSQQSNQDFYRLCLSGAGLFKGYLSPEVIVVIGLELITQTEEETSRQRTVPSAVTLDAVNKMAQAARAPLLEALGRISDHLYQSIAAGIPSMKRYCLLRGIIAQVKAAHLDEQSIHAEIRQAFIDSMETCRGFLQEYISREINHSDADGALLPTGGMDGWTPDSALASSLSSDFTVSDILLLVLPHRMNQLLTHSRCRILALIH
jgi:hypothetical protein